MAMLRAALYCRLSKDDMLQGDSESIKTQKAMLTQYAKEHGFLVVEIYVDDGYSGLNFDRPSFNRTLLGQGKTPYLYLYHLRSQHQSLHRPPYFL